MNCKAGNNNKSLYENSMKMMTNIIRSSSLSIAKMSLGTTRPAASAKNLESMTGSNIIARQATLPQFPGGRRSQEPESSSKPITYLVDPVEGKRSSSYVVREEKSVDGLAEEYIRKVHAKNRSVSDG